MSNSEQFTIDVVGETTGDTRKGLFKTKLRLSHKDYLRQDEIRRGLVGANPQEVSPRAKNTADLFSFIAIHLIEAPQWWVANDNGLDLEDDNVAGTVYEQIVAVKNAAQEKLVAAAEAAKKQIADEPKK